MARKQLRLLDGRRTWGSFDVYLGRYGETRYRLVVFPPGISRDERRLLRIWRLWPKWGAALFLATQVWLVNATSTGWAMAISTAVWLASGAISSALSGDTRTRVRTLTAIAMNGWHDKAAADRLATMQTLITALQDADDQRARGSLSEPEHEAVCWDVYNQLTLIADRPAIVDRGRQTWRPDRPR